MVTIPADLRTPFLGPGPAVLTLGVAVTEGGGAHVTQPDGAFAAAVDKGVAVVRVELSGSDHLCQLLHVGWLDVHDVWQEKSRLLAPAADLSAPIFPSPCTNPAFPTEQCCSGVCQHHSSMELMQPNTHCSHSCLLASTHCMLMSLQASPRGDAGCRHLSLCPLPAPSPC